MKIDTGPDVRTGLRAQVSRGGDPQAVTLADLLFPDDSELGIVVAAYRRWLDWR